MKKALVIFVAVAVILLVGINVVNAFAHDDYSDEELMTMYVDDHYGEDYYGIIDGSDDDYIYFKLYGHGMKKSYCSITREYWTNYYNE